MCGEAIAFVLVCLGLGGVGVGIAVGVGKLERWRLAMGGVLAGIVAMLLISALVGTLTSQSWERGVCEIPGAMLQGFVKLLFLAAKAL